MLDLPQILIAQGNDDGPIRFIGILIFIAIFIFGNVLQWWQKYQAQQRKLEAQRQAAAASAPQVMQRPTPRRAGAQRPAAGARATPGPRRPIASSPPVRGAKLPPRRLAPPPVRPAPERKASQPRPEISQPAYPTPSAPPAHPARTADRDIAASQIGSDAPTAPTRADRIRTIFNARSLKQVFILTELLRPPVALRDSSTPEA